VAREASAPRSRLDPPPLLALTSMTNAPVRMTYDDDLTGAMPKDVSQIVNVHISNVN
jgi:hypothetical protein